MNAAVPSSQVGHKYVGTTTGNFHSSIYMSASRRYTHSFAHEFQTKEHSLYACDASTGQKNMPYLRRKAPSVRLLRELYSEEFKRSACHWPEGFCRSWAQFVCCKWRFFELWAAPLFQGARLFCLKDAKTDVLMHRYIITGTCLHT